MSLEKLFKKIDLFVSQCINTIVSLLKIVLRSKFGIHLPTAQSDTCIILGNGPSLKTSLEKHPEFFNQHPLVCVNNFSTTDEYVILKPTYYVILDFGYWLSDTKIILDTLEALKTKTTWSIRFFVPQIASKSNRFNDLCKANPNIHLHYFNYTVFKGFPFIAHWLYSRNFAMPQSQNVLVVSLFLSINLGFKNIYLLGADHSWHENLYLDEHNTLCVKHVHFYGDAEKVKYVPFVKGSHLNETFKMHEIMTTLGKVFYGYESIKMYADNRGTAIYNASEISFIDVFNRVKL
jgi:hypothetical protein